MKTFILLTLLACAMTGVFADEACGEETFDPETQVCCDNNILPKEEWKCCEGVDQMYNPETHVCCPFEATIEKQDPSHDNCCASSLDSIRPSKPYSYNSKTHQCCGNTITEKNSTMENIRCCGEVMFTGKGQKCCEKSNTIVGEKVKC